MKEIENLRLEEYLDEDEITEPFSIQEGNLINVVLFL